MPRLSGQKKRAACAALKGDAPCSNELYGERCARVRYYFLSRTLAHRYRMRAVDFGTQFLL